MRWPHADPFIPAASSMILLVAVASSSRNAAPILERGDWPPVHPSRVVSVHWERSLAAGASEIAYHVPANRHLIITRMVLVADSGQRRLHLIEDHQGVERLKLKSQFLLETTDGVGLVFRPNSDVVVRNVGSQQDDAELSFFGYTTADDPWPVVAPKAIENRSFTVTLGAGQEQTLLRVPTRRWLTLTNILAVPPPTLLERTAGGDHVIPPVLLSDPHPALVSFQPGSSVVLRNDDTTTLTYEGTLIGYYTEARDEY